MYRKAPFIWVPGQVPAPTPFVDLLRNGSPTRATGRNRWFLFRREFDLPAAPEGAELAITVDGRYLLYVNGQIAARGPARSSPDFQRYDLVSLDNFLKPGRNTAAVLVHVYGIDTGWYQQARGPSQTIFGDGGLYFHLRAKTAAGVSEVLSDEAWRCIETDAWRSDTPTAGWGQDFIEELDGRLLPAGWNDEGANFDDSAWDTAVPLRVPQTPQDEAKGWAEVQAFPTLLASRLPQQSETPVAPSEITALYEVLAQPELPIDQRIYEEPLSALEMQAMPGVEGLLTDQMQSVPITTDGDRDRAILFKFEPLISGYPWIEIDASGGEVIEMAASETIPGEYSDALPDTPRPVRESYLDCAHVARYTARPGKQRFEKFDWTAIRYLLVVFRNAVPGLKVLRVGATSTHYPVENRGAFECSDALLNNLWNVGRYTTMQCTHDAWVDGPGREKRQWLGDGFVHYLISAAAFGPGSQPVDRQFLYHGAESQRPDGLLQMFTPGDHHYTSVQIPDFSLHWTCALGSYYSYTGDIEAVVDLLPSVQRVLAWFARHEGPSALLCDIPYWHFIEWAHTDREGEAATINGLYLCALKSAAELADAVGYDRLARNYRDRVASASLALHVRHWNEARGLYVDSVDPESSAQRGRFSQHANAMMILADVAPRALWPDMITRIMDVSRLRLTAVPPIVNTEVPFDESKHVVQCNTYFSHFLYAALARAGEFAKALPAIRTQYSAMLASGTSTLWESNEPNASTCHAFSASPVYHLSSNVLGVQPIEPGFRKFRIAIQPGDLTYARGVFPCPHGDIEVSWTRDEQGMHIRFSVPDGTEARVELPRVYDSQALASAYGPGQHELHAT